MAQRLLAKNCANIFDGLFKLLNSYQFQNQHKKSLTDFSRNRALSFLDIFTSLLMCNPGPLNTRIRRFFAQLHSEKRKIVTKSALCQARSKLLPSAYQEANKYLVDYYYEHETYKTWHNFRLLSIDGSTLKVPATIENIDHFGVMHLQNADPCPLARFSILSDTLNGLTLDSQLNPYKEGEITVAYNHLTHINQNDIVILDRGYKSIPLLLGIRLEGAHFCCRVSVDQSEPIKDFFESSQKDTVIKMPLSHSAQKALQEKYGLEMATFSIRLIKVKLETGETEILMTSIMDKSLTTYDFKELYHFRWPVEETYKVHKSRTVIESFSGKKCSVIYQDFYSKILLANMSILVSLFAQPFVEENTKDHHNVQKVNLLECTRILNENIITLFYKKNIKGLISKILHFVIQYFEPVRFGRNYKRNLSDKRKRYNPGYVMVS